MEWRLRHQREGHHRRSDTRVAAVCAQAQVAARHRPCFAAVWRLISARRGRTCSAYVGLGISVAGLLAAFLAAGLGADAAGAGCGARRLPARAGAHRRLGSASMQGAVAGSHAHAIRGDVAPDAAVSCWSVAAGVRRMRQRTGPVGVLCLEPAGAADLRAHATRNAPGLGRQRSIARGREQRRPIRGQHAEGQAAGDGAGAFAWARQFAAASASDHLGDVANAGLLLKVSPRLRGAPDAARTPPEGRASGAPGDGGEAHRPPPGAVGEGSRGHRRTRCRRPRAGVLLVIRMA